MLVASVVPVRVGECFHTMAIMLLIADLAPAAERGRYMATMGFSWWIGLTIAPTVGGELLGVSPAVLFIPCA